MKRRNFNCTESIPIDSLNSYEVKTAIKDWAEGNQALKRLLWSCHKNGVETSGCHSGHRRRLPYIEFRIDTSNREKLKHLINAGFSIGKGQVLISFSGNPWSGPTWYTPVLLLNPAIVNDKRKFLCRLYESVNKNEELIDDAIEAFLKIYDFLKDKETPLLFRIVFENGIYAISIECDGNKYDWDYYTRLFEKADMHQFTKKAWRGEIISWEVSSVGYENFSKKMQKINQILRENWTLELPQEIVDGMNERCQALLMRRKFGTDREGIEKMNQWLNKIKDPRMRDVNY